jgi:hypothetical protein
VRPTFIFPGGNVSGPDSGAATPGAATVSEPARLRNRAPHFAQMMSPEASGADVTAALHFGHFISFQRGALRTPESRVLGGAIHQHLPSRK